LGTDTNTGEDQLARIRLLAPTLGKRLKEFLEGCPSGTCGLFPPRRFSGTSRWSASCGQYPVQIRAERGRQWYELTIVMKDRPALFATLRGVLAGWG